MRGKEELKQALEQELQWVKYRQKMLDIMEEKLMQMKELAEQARGKNFTAGKIEEINTKLKNLASQVRALDGESIKTEHGKIIE